MPFEIHTVIHAGFFGWGSPPNVFGVRFSRVGTKFFYWTKALKFEVNFQKHIKIWKIIEKILEKMQIFPKFSQFCGGTVGKNKEYKIEMR